MSDYSSFTANDMVVLACISRAGKHNNSPHISQTVKGVVETMGVRDIYARRSIDKLNDEGFIERSKRRKLVSGAHENVRRPHFVYSITPRGLEMLVRFQGEVR